MRKHSSVSSLRNFLLLALPPLLCLSYFPVIPLGSSDTMNFEFSLPLIWLCIFVPCCAPVIFRSIKALWQNHLKAHRPSSFFLPMLFPLFLLASAIWSANPLRGFLTAAIFWLILGAIFASLQLFRKTPTLRSLFARSFLISAFFTAVFCWLQIILDLLNIPREFSLLCQGCTSLTFGFPHPNGFAIEPQFMGNLLLAPTIFTLYIIIFSPRRRPLFYLLFTFFSATLLLTLSRGAIFSFIFVGTFALIGYIFRFFVNSDKKHLSVVKNTILSATLAIFAFSFALIIQGISSALSPTNDTFQSGIAKSLHHLSLGAIDIRPTSSPNLSSPNSSSSTPTPSNITPAPLPNSSSPTSSLSSSSSTSPSASSTSSPPHSSFDGYIFESTDIRLNLNRLALEAWAKTPSTILFGTGLGSAGKALHSTFPSQIHSPKEIVQNQYLSLLLETGIIGVAFCVVFIIICAHLIIRTSITTKSQFSSSPHRSAPSFAKSLHHHPPLSFAKSPQPHHHSPLSFPVKPLHHHPPLSFLAKQPHPAKDFLITLTLAYALSLLFFSGLPNALHIYLLPPLLYASSSNLKKFVS